MAKKKAPTARNKRIAKKKEVETKFTINEDTTLEEADDRLSVLKGDIQDKQDKLIKSCKYLATFKTSSARDIIEFTNDLLRLESEAKKLQDFINTECAN